MGPRNVIHKTRSRPILNAEALAAIIPLTNSFQQTPDLAAETFSLEYVLVDDGRCVSLSTDSADERIFNSIAFGRLGGVHERIFFWALHPSALDNRSLRPWNPCSSMPVNSKEELNWLTNKLASDSAWKWQENQDCKKLVFMLKVRDTPNEAKVAHQFATLAQRLATVTSESAWRPRLVSRLTAEVLADYYTGKLTRDTLEKELYEKWESAKSR